MRIFFRTLSYFSLSDDPNVRSVMNVTTRMISTPSEAELKTSSISAIELQDKTKACFILCTSSRSQVFLRLGDLVQTFTPAESPEDWAEDETERVSSLVKLAAIIHRLSSLSNLL
ncbi:hypothetical protein BDQ12DRAFT_505827 [Crucibulum laeve]|uniref:Uncharacterized protein n=1 Tax=Crucibulum laeve TaxID=68775 RepID=A0A5C3M4W3_9AGAR|nr:hypothetical protein BDQ12DRAFT_505827 [Crucibulum laeve]